MKKILPTVRFELQPPEPETCALSIPAQDLLGKCLLVYANHVVDQVEDFTGAIWFFFRIYVDLAVFQPYLDLEAGDNQSLKIQVARPEIEPLSSCSASQELNHSATAAPCYGCKYIKILQQNGDEVGIFV